MPTTNRPFDLIAAVHLPPEEIELALKNKSITNPDQSVTDTTEREVKSHSTHQHILQRQQHSHFFLGQTDNKPKGHHCSTETASSSAPFAAHSVN